MHSAVGTGRRQPVQRVHAHAVVPGAASAAAPGQRAAGDARRSEWVAPAGAVGQSPQRAVPWLCRHHCCRPGTHRRCGGGGAVRAPRACGERAGCQWRGRQRTRRAGRDADLARRDRHQPRRHHRRRGRPAGSGRPVRRARVVDGRCRVAARAPVLAQDRHPHGHRQHQRDQAQGRCEHAGAAGRQAAGAQRGGLLQTCRWTSRSPLPRMRATGCWAASS